MTNESIAVVTGASSGIGAATARHLAQVDYLGMWVGNSE